jgi:hypothetical protein
MSMLRDQKDLLCAFNAEGVEYLIVGGHAVNMYGVPRLTKDLDVFIRSSDANAERVFRALVRFGAPMQGILPADFCSDSLDVFQIGVEPSRVDILQRISGVDFNAAWERRVDFELEEGVIAPFISLEDLLANKLETARLQDLADAEHLNKVKNGR